MLKVIIYSDDTIHTDLLEAYLPRFSRLFRKQSGRPNISAGTRGDSPEEEYNLSILDIDLFNWKEILLMLRCRDREKPVLALAPPGKVREIADALRHGAYDWLSKPVCARELEKLLARLFYRTQQPAEAREDPAFNTLIGKHPAIIELREKIRKYAPEKHAVLLTGESGTGKGVIASIMHSLSPRRDGPFCTRNCGTLPPALIESELFGTRAGSYTGALNRPGGFELSNGGSFFLDEVGELNMESQVKLLKVLEEGVFYPLGSNEPKYTDTRFIAATNRRLKEMVESRQFREDLFYRLYILPIEVPPLRERKSDIPLLTEHLLRNSPCRIDPLAMDLLMDYHWPGNIRQLSAVLTRAALTAEGDIITPGDIDY